MGVGAGKVLNGGYGNGYLTYIRSIAYWKCTQTSWRIGSSPGVRVMAPSGLGLAFFMLRTCG